MGPLLKVHDEARLEIAGGTHASMLTAENPEQIVNIASAERQTALFIMTDPHFELICNPDKFDKGCLGEVRKRKLSYMQEVF